MSASGRAYIEEQERLDRIRDAAEEMYEALKDALLQIDDGPNDCSGTMSNGDRVWKGSFLRRVENMRSALAKAEGRAP